jgi:23S rRNA (adenine2503-C2)-methyltransferase
MNGVSELPYADPSPTRTNAFVDILREAGIAATVRKRKGADIDAACGQLRLAEEQAATASQATQEIVDAFLPNV